MERRGYRTGSARSPSFWNRTSSARQQAQVTVSHSDEGAASEHPMVSRPQQMPPDPEEVPDDTVNRGEALQLALSS